MLGIIGGSGVYYLGKLIEKEEVITPYGYATVHRCKLLKNEILFIPRHGEGHQFPPHNVNYRANVYALKKLGVTAAFATYASGVISGYKVGDLILLYDFIGFSAPITFFDDFSGGIRHTDMTEPFELKDLVKQAAKIAKIKLRDNGIVATMHGPRFETKAEIQTLKKMGANLVNMTSAYEITLFKEMEIPFGAIAVGTNYASGNKKKNLSTSEVMEQMKKANGKISSIASELV
ncbi:MTAP family purine nucleoside phosphorylase, partial [Candidatus Micrarchaeota archaeon]|nr:MTAP family purine nucleoside phosphorylase [Candidatus Micrarchaeota archaeon]